MCLLAWGKDQSSDRRFCEIGMQWNNLGMYTSQKISDVSSNPRGFRQLFRLQSAPLPPNPKIPMAAFHPRTPSPPSCPQRMPLKKAPEWIPHSVERTAARLESAKKEVKRQMTTDDEEHFMCNAAVEYVMQHGTFNQDGSVKVDWSGLMPWFCVSPLDLDEFLNMN